MCSLSVSRRYIITWNIDDPVLIMDLENKKHIAGLYPLLFLVYTNDIPESIPKEQKLRLFADDTNVFITADNNAQLKALLKKTQHHSLTGSMQIKFQ